MNNGFIGFENVRIPREQMLMKNSKVLEVCNIYGFHLKTTSF
jgi:hypothetical protein